MGNFDPILLTMTQAPTNHHIRITITQPTGSPGTPGYVSGGVAISAPLGTEVDIDFKVTGAQGPTYYTCGLVLALVSGAGASTTGSVNFAKHKCEHGTLTLYDANVVIANYNFYLQIQDPNTGYIGLVDPKITTGGS
jgi:hypothetical protein